MSLPNWIAAWNEGVLQGDEVGNLVNALIDERDTLSAVVEGQREALQSLFSRCMESGDIGHQSLGLRLVHECEEALALTPATALALHDAEVLERVAAECDAISIDESGTTNYRAGAAWCTHRIRLMIASLRAGGEG